MPILEYESGSSLVSFELPRERGFKVDIGRDDSNDLVFADREMALYHASVIRSSNGFFILLSRDFSEIVINDHQVYDLKVLRDGDTIRLGQTQIKYLEIQSEVLTPGVDLVGVNCLFCQDTFKEDDKVIRCPKCDAGYHASCWELMFNEPCAVRHCGYFIGKSRGN